MINLPEQYTVQLLEEIDFLKYTGAISVLLAETSNNPSASSRK